MLARGSRKTHLSIVGVMIVAAVSLAWSGRGIDSAGAETLATETTESDCRFALRASNNLSFDVWVMLYDSRVQRPNRFGFGVFSPSFKQMKIQNQRIRRGGTMDRRYTAEGKCSAKRIWQIKVVRGDPGKVSGKWVEIVTQGTGSGSRTVDLGPSSKW